MNPFTESTVARPLACQGRPRGLRVDHTLAKRKRRTRVGKTTCAEWRGPRRGRPPARVPVAGPPAAELSVAELPVSAAPPSALSIAGTFATAAGLLAAFVLPGLAFALDVNVATQEQLRKVRGIGPKTAQIIIEERSRGGRYESLEDLSDRVKGIGAKKAAALQAAGLSAGASGAARASGAPGQSSASAAAGVSGVAGVVRASPSAAGGAAPASVSKPVAPASSVKPSGAVGGRSVFRLPSQPK